MAITRLTLPGKRAASPASKSRGILSNGLRRPGVISLDKPDHQQECVGVPMDFIGQFFAVRMGSTLCEKARTYLGRSVSLPFSTRGFLREQVDQ